MTISYYISLKFLCVFYRSLKAIARIALPFLCRKINISHPEYLKESGPLLLACNHPNSFLDSILLDVLFERPVWSLARGDVFKKKSTARLLTAMKILPVYRTSEGAENLGENYKTFDACIAIFRAKGIVTIFSEGRCINEWHLRPLKKGTARLAIKAWKEDIPLKVLPVGINYSSFRRFGKNVFIRFGEPITMDNIDITRPDGVANQDFNRQLLQQLEQLVFDIAKKDIKKQEALLEIKQSPAKKLLLFLPAAAGWLLHAPLYLPIKRLVWKRTAHIDHYDSVMTGILMLAYPLYLLLLAIITFIISQSWWAFSILVVLPFTAWAYIQIKPQLDHH